MAALADAPHLGHLLHLHAAAEERAAQDEASFVRDVTSWMADAGGRHVPFPAVSAGAPVGCGWLALGARPPRPGNASRLAADIQSVFVLEDHRRRGIGSALTEAMLAHARAVGAERVTVHSGRRAVDLYSRAGFSSSPQLMMRTLLDRP